MNEAEFNPGDYVYHNTFGVGKLVRPAEREGRPGFEIDFRNRPGHFMSLEILRRTQRTHPDSIRVFAYERRAEAERLMQEDPAGIVIRTVGQSRTPLERPEIERLLIESGLVSGPEQFRTWWGKALPKLKGSPWLDITLQGSKVFVRRLETPRFVPTPEPEAPRRESSRPTPAQIANTPTPRPVTPPTPSPRPTPPAAPKPVATAPRPAPTPVPTNNGFDLADFRRQLRLLETQNTLPEEAKTYLLNITSRPNVPVSAQFTALLTVYQKGGISKTELLDLIKERAEAGAGLDQIDDANVRSDLALLVLEENKLPPAVLSWLSGSFVADLTLAELVLDRLVELRQFDILGKSIEKVTSGLEEDLTRLAGELDFVRWMIQKEPDLAALALANGYPWPPANLTARIIRLLLTLIEMEPHDERQREARKDSLIEVARLLEKRSDERDPATITRLVQALNNGRGKVEKLVESFGILMIQPDRPLLAKLTRNVQLNLASLGDAPLVMAILQMEVVKAERTDFGLVHWWIGEAVRLKNLRLARSIFEFLLLRLQRALDENEELRCMLLLSQMVDLELINQNQAAPVRTALTGLFRKIAARKVKVDEEENGFMLNLMISSLNEAVSVMEQRLSQALTDKESAEEELRTLRRNNRTTDDE
jgi:hypothetical protein